MPPMNNARRRAMRAILSAVAGGGLTAAGLVGPVSGAIADTPASTGTSTSPLPPSAGGSAPVSGTEPSATTTPTTPTATTPTNTTTSTTPQGSPVPTGEAPVVVLGQGQRPTAGGKPASSSTSTSSKKTKTTAKAKKNAAGANNVALSPQVIAAQAAALASSEASIQALEFYRIPIFLLPIYKAAAVQYGVPWQILAAINEIETDYGTDLSVSTAGAVGWMQFMPATWLQYGVDALNAGYADPYNPVDAIFAAARYLRAAGAANDLQAAILAYNHSEEYVSSVLLRAKLISSYPRSVIATLTGLVDGQLPVTGKHVSWTPAPPASPPSSTATANASAVTGRGAATAPTPAAAAAAARSGSGASAPLRLVDLASAPNAQVVAVQDGRIEQLGTSRALGRYLVLRDVYGDVFTYAGLGSIAPTYTAPSASGAGSRSPLLEVADKREPTPSLPATAGIQSPLTLSVRTPKHPSAPSPTAGGQATIPDASSASTPPGMNRIRLFAHPGNPDARAAAAANAATRARLQKAAQRLPLRPGAVVTGGTVLGGVDAPHGAQAGHLRFAVRPAGDTSTIDPGIVLSNWALLQSALHPDGARATDPLLGATASDVFLLSKAQLERTVLSDPGITITGCSRHDVASGAVDRRVLAVLAFLSRSGLQPTVSSLRCGQSPITPSGAASAAYRGEQVEISAIGGITIADHQGVGSVTDLTVRTLLTLPSEFVPSSIDSLMRYPGAPSTHASSAFWNRIRLEFLPAAAPLPSATGAGAAHAGRLASVPIIGTGALSAAQWDQLIGRAAGLPGPTVATKPSSAAITDPPRH